MRKEFIPQEKALALKELGFDEPCWAWWHIEDRDTRYCYSEQRSPIINSRETEIIGLPTFQQAFEFFEEKFGLYSEIQIDKTTEPKWCFTISKFIGNPNDLAEKEWGWENVPVDNWYLYRTRKEAELVCLSKIIEASKEKSI